MPTTTTTVTNRTHAAYLVIEHAELTGLPLPFSVRAADFDDRIDLQFASLAQLTEWAKWLDAPIGEHRVGDDIHHEILGSALDQPIRCNYVATASARDVR